MDSEVLDPKEASLCELQGQQFLNEAARRIHAYYDDIGDGGNAGGLAGLWRRSYYQFYSGFSKRGDLGKALGIQGTSSSERSALLKLSTNHYGNILRHLHTLITQKPPLVDAVAIRETERGKTGALKTGRLLEFYQKKHNVDEVISRAVLFQLIFGMGYVVCDWKLDYMRPLPTAELMTYAGDADFMAKDPFNVIKDLCEERPSWHIVRNFVEVGKLKRMYPKLAKKQEGILPLKDDYSDLDYRDRNYAEQIVKRIDVYTLVHVPIEKYPQGRRVVFVRGEILDDTTLRGARVIEVAHEYRVGTSIGTTASFDLLELQTAYDNLVSAEINNAAFFGLNSIVATKESGVELTKVGRGINLIEVDAADAAAMPQTLDLLKDHPGVVGLAEMIKKNMELVSGINAVLRGEAAASQSGQALALITTMGHQFASGLTRSYRVVYQQFGEALLGLLKQNTIAAHTLTMQGAKGERTTLQVGPETLADEYDVTVELVNPLKSTAQGREALASTLLERGFLQTPGAYLDVLLHGKIDALLEEETSLPAALRSERERLINGEPVVVFPIQDHNAFIRSDMSLMNNEKYASNPEIAARVTDAVLRRKELWQRESFENGDLFKLAGIPTYDELIIPSSPPPAAPPIVLPEAVAPPPGDVGAAIDTAPLLSGVDVPPTTLPKNPITNEPPPVALEPTQG